MAYRVTETESAEKDYHQILKYMVEKLGNPSAASAFLDEVDDKYAKVEDNPYLYEAARNPELKKRGYRRIPIKNDVALYLVDEKEERS